MEKIRFSSDTLFFRKKRAPTRNGIRRHVVDQVDTQFVSQIQHRTRPNQLHVNWSPLGQAEVQAE